MKKEKRKYKIKIFLLLLLLFVCFIGISRSLARYSSQVTGKVIGNVTKPIMEIHGEQSILVTAIDPVGEYHFSIKNYNEQGILNEVDMEYQIEVICAIKEGITFELYQENEYLPLKNNKSAMKQLQKNQKQEMKYTLKVIYEKEKMQEQADVKESIEIKIHSIQKKEA